MQNTNCILNQRAGKRELWAWMSVANNIFITNKMCLHKQKNFRTFSTLSSDHPQW